jgi:hypothetical protein
MGVNINWDDPDQTILRYDFTAAWDCEAYIAAADDEWQMLEESDCRVDTIVDLTRLESLPDDIARRIWSAAAHLHPKRCLLVLVGEPAITGTFARILTDIYPRSAADIVQVTTPGAARLVISMQYGFFYENSDLPDVVPDNSPILAARIG